MLKGVSPLLTPELLHVIAQMGHGDVLAIVDRNYPAHRHPRVLPVSGSDTTNVAEAICQLFPVDTFVEPAAWRMVPQDDTAFMGDSHRAFARTLEAAEGRYVEVAGVRRMDFYEQAAGAFAVVHTSDDRPYSCFLLMKGVVF